MSAAKASHKHINAIPQTRNARADGLVDGLDFLRGITLDITVDLMLKVDVANGSGTRRSCLSNPTNSKLSYRSEGR